MRKIKLSLLMVLMAVLFTVSLPVTRTTTIQSTGPSYMELVSVAYADADPVTTTTPVVATTPVAAPVTTTTTTQTVSPADKAGWAKIGWEVLSLILGVLATIIMTLGSALIYKYFGVKLGENEIGLLQQFADQAIGYAEQRAKNGSINKENRSQVAVEFMVNAVKNSKLKNIGTEYAIKLIESQLGIQNQYAIPSAPVEPKNDQPPSK